MIFEHVKFKRVISIENRRFSNVLHVYCFSVTKGEINFHKAAKENDLESVRKLLSEYHVNVNCKNNVSSQLSSLKDP